MGELGVSRATVMRDLKTMRHFFGAPIVYMRTPPCGYSYRRDAGGFELPGFWLDECELWVLMAVVNMLGQLNHGLLAEQLAPIRRRLGEILEDSGIDPKRIQGHFCTVPPGLHRKQGSGGSSDGSGTDRNGDGHGAASYTDGRRAPPRHGVFRAVAEATLRRKRLQIDYRPRFAERSSTRVVDPQRLVFCHHAWYLLAIDQAVDALRLFRVECIGQATVMRATAKDAAVDAIAERIEAAEVTLLSDDHTEHERYAVLRFSPYRARWLQDTLWHPRQHVRRLDDGGLELTVPFAHPHELIQEVLRYGNHVEVVEPLDLRDAVASVIRAAAERYTDL